MPNPQRVCGLNTFCPFSIDSMRRWLSIFLLIVLPLQVSWVMAASYCQHETGWGEHFGHHVHKHQTEGDENGSDDKLADGTSPNTDNDCPLCHAESVAALISFGNSLPEVQAVADCCRTARPFLSIPSDQPERPNWNVAA